MAKEMFSRAPEKKLGKLMRKYVRNRIKQEKLYAEQLERLQSQLRDKTIDQDTYDRLRKLLEINHEQRREEARALASASYV